MATSSAIVEERKRQALELVERLAQVDLGKITGVMTAGFIIEAREIINDA